MSSIISNLFDLNQKKFLSYYVFNRYDDHQYHHLISIDNLQSHNQIKIPLESTGRGLESIFITQMTSDLSKQIKLNTSRFCEYSISLIYIIYFTYHII